MNVNWEFWGVLFICVVLVILCIVILIVSIKKSSVDKYIDIDVRCKFNKKELQYVESIMSKYRCTFDELILLGAWKFYEEGRDVFDEIDSRRNIFTDDSENSKGE